MYYVPDLYLYVLTVYISAGDDGCSGEVIDASKPLQMYTEESDDFCSESSSSDSESMDDSQQQLPRLSFNTADERNTSFTRSSWLDELALRAHVERSSSARRAAS